jgi:hypothetical protein
VSSTCSYSLLIQGSYETIGGIRKQSTSKKGHKAQVT